MCKHYIIATAVPSKRLSRRKSTCWWITTCSNLVRWKL